MDERGKPSRPKKRGRPYKAPGDRHECRYDVRLNDAQADLLEQIAEQRDIPPRTVARDALLIGLAYYMASIASEKAA